MIDAIETAHGRIEPTVTEFGTGIPMPPYVMDRRQRAYFYDAGDAASVIRAFNAAIGPPPVPPDALLGSALKPVGVQQPLPGGLVTTLQTYMTDVSVTAELEEARQIYNTQVQVYQAEAIRLMAEMDFVLGVPLPAPQTAVRIGN